MSSTYLAQGTVKQDQPIASEQAAQVFGLWMIGRVSVWDHFSASSEGITGAMCRPSMAPPTTLYNRYKWW